MRNDCHDEGQTTTTFPNYTYLSNLITHSQKCTVSGCSSLKKLWGKKTRRGCSGLKKRFHITKIRNSPKVENFKKQIIPKYSSCNTLFPPWFSLPVIYIRIVLGGEWFQLGGAPTCEVFVPCGMGPTCRQGQDSGSGSEGGTGRGVAGGQ